MNDNGAHMFGVDVTMLSHLQLSPDWRGRRACDVCVPKHAGTHFYDRPFVVLTRGCYHSHHLITLAWSLELEIGLSEVAELRRRTHSTSTYLFR